MTFNSFTFALFFLLVLGLYQLPLSWRARKGMLLCSSYLFYAAWNPPFVSLLVVSTVVDWVAGKRIYASRGTPRSAWLVLSLCTNLGILAYFKYSPFLLQSFSELAAGVGIVFEPATAGIVLPIGISFYTFQTLSYSIDIYRRRLRPATSFLDYALFVTFFPQLVAGPIVRASEFLPQCLEPKRADARQMGWGFILLTVGLFQKTILADQLFAPIADVIYAEPDRVSFATAWLGTLAFSGQIFFDFAGYSACAIGAALCLGFALPDNFRYPYAAIGFSDFWRRWHISLSSWLRDYLYIPLGGNRHGRFSQAASLMLTMLIGGLWHGAAWTFVVWGGAPRSVSRRRTCREGDCRASCSLAASRRADGSGAIDVPARDDGLGLLPRAGLHERVVLSPGYVRERRRDFFRRTASLLRPCRSFGDTRFPMDDATIQYGGRRRTAAPMGRSALYRTAPLHHGHHPSGRDAWLHLLPILMPGSGRGPGSGPTSVAYSSRLC